MPPLASGVRGFCVSNQGTAMTTPIDLDDEDDEDLYDDDLDYLEMIGEEEWEDRPAYIALKEAMPKGWTMVKVINFTTRSLTEIEAWLAKECRGAYERVGFRSGCAYNVAVQFEDGVDAVMFKMRWR